MRRPAGWPYLWVPMLLSVCGIAGAQTPQPPPSQSEEMTTKDTPATFRTKVNLVMVPVVVRDKQGHLVGGLTRESFRLYDKGKPQEIDRFTVEKPGSELAPARPAAEHPAAGERPSAARAAMPRRFMGTSSTTCIWKRAT